MSFIFRQIARYLIWSFLKDHVSPQTNATFFRKGTQQLHAKAQRPWAWHWQAGYVRFLIKLGIFLSITVGPILYFFFPTVFWWTVGILGFLLALDLGVVGYRRFRHHAHRSRYVDPLAAALAPRLGVEEKDPDEWLTVPLDFTTNEDAAVTVKLPKEFAATKESREMVTGIVTSKLGIVDVDADYRMVGAPTAVFTRAPQPPALVKFAELRAEIDACKPGEIVLGLDRRRNVFGTSFLTDDPHIAASCGSGRGKSTFLQLVAAQILHQDVRATVTAIDPKMTSLEPLVGIPGVTVANDPRNIQGMWDAIFDFRNEMDRRMDVLSTDPTAEFPFALLIIDELNQFSAMSAVHWREIKEKGDQARPPVWGHIAAVLWQGRALKCHVAACGQRLDDRATGGIGLRDSFGFRALAGYTQNQWMMLIGTTPIPRSQRARGRWIFSDGENLTWTQVAYATPQEVRDYAMEGRRPKLTTTPPEVSQVMSQVDPSNTPLGAETPPSATRPATAAGELWVVGLEAAAGHVGMTVDAFRKRRERAGGAVAGEVRRGNRPAWRSGELQEWATRQPDGSALSIAAIERDS